MYTPWDSKKNISTRISFNEPNKEIVNTYKGMEFQEVDMMMFELNKISMQNHEPVVLAFGNDESPELLEPLDCLDDLLNETVIQEPVKEDSIPELEELQPVNEEFIVPQNEINEIYNLKNIEYLKEVWNNSKYGGVFHNHNPVIIDTGKPLVIKNEIQKHEEEYIIPYDKELDNYYLRKKLDKTLQNVMKVHEEVITKTPEIERYLKKSLKRNYEEMEYIEKNVELLGNAEKAHRKGLEKPTSLPPIKKLRTNKCDIPNLKL